MNKNKEKYVKAMDKIKPNDELKGKTFKKIEEINSHKVRPLIIKYVAAVAVVTMCFSVGIVYTNKNGKNPTTKAEEQGAVIAQNNLPRFESEEELKKALTNHKGGIGIVEDAEASVDYTPSGESSETNKNETSNSHSETNVQVEGVDEADIVKTDGNYIYYVSSGKIYILNSSNLNIESTIKYSDRESFSPSEIYIVGDKLVVLGNYSKSRSKPIINYNDMDDALIVDDYYTPEKIKTKIIVYDISNKSKPKETRTVKVDGNYITSRMIGDNIYTVSSQYLYYWYDDIGDEKLNDILPTIEDSENSTIGLSYSDIAYFKDTHDTSFMNVIAFNINNKEKVQVESFFGASDTVYASTENLYVTQYNWEYTSRVSKSETTIYKFNLNNSKISLQGQATVKGSLHDQFSMDEYNGNLRVATSTYGRVDSNKLYIFDKNLEEIGRIGNFSRGENIKSVRFIGKIGYVVTFKQIDPLFTIDLSDPTNPKLKGELEIPGYSSYLHPYDETHIIGIGYNTETNKYGGTVTSSMKMSMFDVSDLENPKEMFSVNIGEGYTYSEINYNHKALFYNKEKNLIGFATSEYSNSTNEFHIYQIDLQKGEFKEYGTLENKAPKYYDSLRRAIYINDKIYTLTYDTVTEYDMNTLKQTKETNLE